MVSIATSVKQRTRGGAHVFHPVHALVADFDFYLSYFQTSVASPAPQLHRRTINLRHTLPNTIAAVTDPRIHV